jgi:hypothetical protein
MIAGMVPMAFGWNEGSEQSAPLARAVIGGLAAATVAALVVLPCVFAIVQGAAGRQSASIDPADPASSCYDAQLWDGATGAVLASNVTSNRDGLSPADHALEPPFATRPQRP